MDLKFLGRGWKFPVTVDASTGKIVLSQYEEDIKEAIKVLIWTAKGERVMRPDFGCGIHDYVFEATDYTTLRLMETSIVEAITKWEPRVTNVQVQITVDGNEQGNLSISAQYTVRSTNNQFNQVYPFFLSEGSK